jgi:anaerobic magnesium-protoporphyrin IX monomethyl ester cyclase
MPNGALTSLAGNIDAHHGVAVADLILSHGCVRETVIRLIHEFNAEVIGL